MASEEGSFKISMDFNIIWIDIIYIIIKDSIHNI